MTEDIFVCFKEEYTLSPQIPFIELSTDIPKVNSMSIEFITDKNNLIGFILILEKELKLTVGETELDHFSKFLTHIICMKSKRLTRCYPSTHKYIMKNGKSVTGSSSTHRYSIKGSPVKLNIQEDLLRISKSSNPLIKQHIGYLAKTIIFYQQGFPDHSIIEGFKIIEYQKNFINYNMYFALRNILAHSPYYSTLPHYKDKTINYFKESFNKDDFEYIKYEPENKLIILDLDSNKTLRRLNEIVIELITPLKIFLNLE